MNGKFEQSISLDATVADELALAPKAVSCALPMSVSEDADAMDREVGWAPSIALPVSVYRILTLTRYMLVLTFCSLCFFTRCDAQTVNPMVPAEHARSHVLGPDDQIAIRALDIEEIDGKVARVDVRGYVDVPLLGKFKAAGLSVEQLEAELTKELGKYVREPHVSVTISEYRSQPVSVLGAVNLPGAYNLTGPNTLVEMLSKAGGLRNDAGNTVNITRRRALGAIPLPSAKSDPLGEFSTAQVNLKSLLEAKNPQDNITIAPTDVISVPRAELVYIVGAVRRPGGFVLNERENITVLQAVSMAEGLEKTSAAKRAKIIRRGMTTGRTEIPVNLEKILSGKSADVPLLANDILFIPNSGAKSVGYRAIEAAIQMGTGVAIFRR